MRAQIISMALSFAIALPISVQNTSTKLPGSSAALSFQFSTMALKNLRQIFDFDGAPKHGHAPTLVRTKDLYDSLGELSDAARTKPEIAVARLLMAFLSDRLDNNESREELFGRAWFAFHLHHEESDETEAAKESVRADVNSRGVVEQMTDSEKLCRDGIDSMLREQRYHPVTDCKAVRVDIQKDLQFR